MAKQTKKVTTKGSKKTVSVPSRLATVIKRHPLRFWGTLVLFVVLVGIIVWQGYIWHEKQQFNRAEKTLDALQSDIIAALGQPLSSSKEKSCSYASAKYYQIDSKPNCRIMYQISYPKQTDVFMDESFKKINSIVRESGDFDTVQVSGVNGPEIAIDSSSPKQERSRSLSFKFKPGSFDCYIIVKGLETDIYPSPETQIKSSCYKETTLALYPVL